MGDKPSEEELLKQLDKIDGRIEILQAQQKIKEAKCVVCKKKNCEVISFFHRLPIHNVCHIYEMKKMGLYK